MAPDIDSVRRQFYEEAKELLEDVSEKLLQVEARPDDDDLLNEVFRGIHTIKGSAGGFDLDLVSDFAHELEELLDALRSKSIKVTPVVVDSALAGADAIADMLLTYQKGGVPQIDHGLMDHFRSLHARSRAAAKPDTAQPDQAESVQEPDEQIDLTPQVISAFAELAKGSHRICLVTLHYTDDHLANGFDPKVFLDALRQQAQRYLAVSDLTEFPLLERFEPLAFYLDLKIYVAVTLSVQEILELTFDPELIHVRDITQRFNDAAPDDAADPAGDTGIDQDRGKAFLTQAGQYRDVLAVALADGDFGEERVATIIRTLEDLAAACRAIGLLEGATLAATAAERATEPQSQAWQESLQAVVQYLARLEDEPQRLGELLVADGKVTEQDIQEALREQKAIGEILLDRGKVKPEDIADSVRRQELLRISKEAKGDTDAEVRTMRVDERKIDHFSNLIGELLIARNTYDFVSEELESLKEVPANIKKSITDNLHQFSRIMDDMQLGVMGLRMVPIKGVVHKLKRVVRDLSRKQGKQIDFITSGNDIEIDKKISDLIFNPLIHVIRNACDHGIETPAQRSAKGKSETGTIRLEASLAGSQITIQVIDDGKGFDKTQLLEKAARAGFDVSQEMSEDAIFDLAFLPGVSTAAAVTDLSGRGVGMDVVKATITESLGGTIHLWSEVDHGSELTFTIPMSIGIANSLIVEADGVMYAVPVDAVESTQNVAPDRITARHNSFEVILDGAVVYCQFLSQLLFPDHNREHPAQEQLEHFLEVSVNRQVPLMIVTGRKGKRGLIVDRFHKNMDVAVKPVPGQLRKIKLLSGVSIMGDGTVLLMINVDEVV